MEQYIDKSALVAEIERRLEKIANASSEGNRELSAIHGAQQCELINLVQYIDTLEVKEVDLEKEIKSFTMSKELYEADSAIKAVAEHFFELGLNSQTKDMQEALRMEYEKGRADVLRCIDPDVMVADFCSQPLSKTRSIASIYRQGIIDIVKRINNNEKTSITGTRSIDDGGVQLPKP